MVALNSSGGLQSLLVHRLSPPEATRWFAICTVELPNRFTLDHERQSVNLMPTFFGTFSSLLGLPPKARAKTHGNNGVSIVGSWATGLNTCEFWPNVSSKLSKSPFVFSVEIISVGLSSQLEAVWVWSLSNCLQNAVVVSAVPGLVKKCGLWYGISGMGKKGCWRKIRFVWKYSPSFPTAILAA